MLILVLVLFCCPSTAFSTYFSQSVLKGSSLHSDTKQTPLVQGMNTCHEDSMTCSLLHSHSRHAHVTRSFNPNRIPRGGNQEEDEIIDLDVLSDSSSSSAAAVMIHHSTIHESKTITHLSATNPKASAAFLPAAIISSLQKFTNMYSTALVSRPILTKSMTAGFIFALSDYTAQKMNSSHSSASSDINWIRTLSSGLVGLFYFGPAAHAWYGMIFQLLPGTSLGSTLCKATLGQLIFGPSFTCVFFAVSLLQSNSFTLMNLWTKIQTDLPKAWLAGLSFWPLVDLVSYSMIPKDYIPLFVNFCSFVWTIYLSIVANQKK